MIIEKPHEFQSSWMIELKKLVVNSGITTNQNWSEENFTLKFFHLSHAFNKLHNEVFQQV